MVSRGRLKVRCSSLLLKGFLISVLFILAVSIVAADSDIVVKPIKNEISTLETAEFQLKITNNADMIQSYTIYSLQSGQGWNVDPFPASDKVIENVVPGHTYTTTIKVNPLEEFSPGIYYVQFTVESDLGERYNEQAKIYLSPERPLDYLPAIKVTPDLNEKINPKEAQSIKLFLENRNPLDLKDLIIQIESEMPEFKKEVSVDLPPMEKKTVEFSVIPNPYQQPKEYMLFFVFKRNDQTVKVIDQKVEIISLVTDFTTEMSGKDVWLKQFRTVLIKNEGNVLNTQEVKVPVSFFQALFSTGAKIVKEEGKRYMVWEVALHPNESLAKDYVINYRLIIYVLIFALIMFLFYLSVKSPLMLIKRAATTKSDSEGALSEIKITLEVKNKTSKTVKNVEIIDLVPGIANVEKSLELGTLKPKEIKHLKKGTKVIWSLAELEGHEHRMITYKLKAKLNIVGTFSLPRAIVEYSKGKSKAKAYSNLFMLES